jgi:hypothetical protein
MTYLILFFGITCSWFFGFFYGQATVYKRMAIIPALKKAGLDEVANDYQKIHDRNLNKYRLKTESIK